MLQKIVIGILVVVLSGTIGKGVIKAFALDEKVARVIKGFLSSGLVEATGWILTGAFGLVCLIVWIAFHADERIADYLSPIPNFASVTFSTWDMQATHFVKDGKTNVDIAIYLKNTNQYPISYTAKLHANANGKDLIDKNGSKTIDVSAIASANETITLIYFIPDVPTPSTEGASNQNTIAGWAEYDLTYAVAPSGKRTRRTAKRVEMSTGMTLKPSPPPGGKGTVVQGERSRAMFSNEKEQ